MPMASAFQAIVVLLLAVQLVALFATVESTDGFPRAGRTSVQSSANQPERSKRTRRNAANFGMMIACATGRNPVDYVGYGCWCGKGGKGPVMDAVDDCCRQHDLCWSRARRFGCGYGLWAQYDKWHCWEKQPMGCEFNTNPCGRIFCECDAIASICFKQHPYQEELRAWKGACREPSIRGVLGWIQQPIRSILSKPRIPWAAVFSKK